MLQWLVPVTMGLWAIWTWAQEQERLASTTAEFFTEQWPMRPGREVAMSRAILDCAVVHIPDLDQDAEYRRRLR